MAIEKSHETLQDMWMNLVVSKPQLAFVGDLEEISRNKTKNTKHKKFL